MATNHRTRNKRHETPGHEHVASEVVAVTLDLDHRPRLDAVAARLGVNRSKLVRRAVDDLLARYEQAPEAAAA